MKPTIVKRIGAIFLTAGCLAACSPFPPDVAWETEPLASTPSRVIRDRAAPIDKAAISVTEFLPETEKETDVPETFPPEMPETIVTDELPETQAAEAPVPAVSTVTPEGSTMTLEQAEALAGLAYYWAPSGTKIHTTPYCPSLREVVYAGTMAEAESAKDGGFCKRCKTPNQTVEAILGCYTNEDYRK